MKNITKRILAPLALSLLAVSAYGGSSATARISLQVIDDRPVTVQAQKAEETKIINTVSNSCSSNVKVLGESYQLTPDTQGLNCEMEKMDNHFLVTLSGNP